MFLYEGLAKRRDATRPILHQRVEETEKGKVVQKQ
jgi:hypothetical protein